MKRYIGTKVINAKPMNRLEYNEFRGWTLPADENGADEGYLVEYVDGGKPNTPQYAGYVSWSPKSQFEQAYRQTQGMTFGQAIEALKIGKSVRRAGWNGAGLWLELKRPCSSSDMTLPYIFLCYPPDAKINPGCRVPWLASQTDTLTDDWILVE